MADLTQVFNQMTREDGSLDVIRRRSELDGLLRALLPDEIRRAKDILSAISFVSDIIPRFPMEILLLILSHIEDLVDFKNMRQVSKTWQKLWTLDPVCDKLMKTHFRPFFKGDYQQLSHDERCDASVVLTEQLRAMKNGQYHSMKIYKYSELGGLGDDAQTSFLNRQYNNGRVAWAEGPTINVYSLRTGSMKTYMTPARTDIHRWTMSDDILVIMESGSIPKLYAHYLCRTHANSLPSVTIPSPISQIVASQSHRVGIVAENGDIFLWDIASGRVKQIEYAVNPIPLYRGRCEIKLLLPPTLDDTLYVCTMAKIKKGQGEDNHTIVKMVMQKYTDGELINTTSISFPQKGLERAPYALRVSIREIDDNGSYNICQLPLDFPSTWTDLGCDHRWHKEKRSGDNQRQLIMQIAYNICDDKFSTNFYHLPSGQKHFDDVNFTTPTSTIGNNRRPKRYHFWANNLYLPLIGITNSEALSRDSPSRIPIKHALLLAIRSCDQIRGTPTDINYLGGYGPESSKKKVWTSKGRYSNFDLGVSHCLVGPIELAQTPMIPDRSRDILDNNTRDVIGDGSFLVLFGDYDFVVWSYNKSITPRDFD
ncbi:hypothetical protein V492_08423 [Pseudogymnoascus sp. VKM F-4246]|nr:hypothetical protein V492_08423 [Pseudogymnoascus sp. VKM F-4246]